MSTSGWRLIWRRPSSPITVNHRIMIGPNTLAMPAVPRCWTANRAIRITTEIGITQSANAGVATSKPSTADSTEIAGVINPSPYSNAVPNTPSVTTAAATFGDGLTLGRDDERGERQDAALAVVVGPHHEQQVLETDHDDQRPEGDRCHAVGAGLVDLELGVVERLADRVERAGTDVAEHDAQCTEGESRHSAGAAMVLAHRSDTLTPTARLRTHTVAGLLLRAGGTCAGAASWTPRTRSSTPSPRRRSPATAGPTWRAGSPPRCRRRPRTG